MLRIKPNEFQFFLKMCGSTFTIYQGCVRLVIKRDAPNSPLSKQIAYQERGSWQVVVVVFGPLADVKMLAFYRSMRCLTGVYTRGVFAFFTGNFRWR